MESADKLIIDTEVRRIAAAVLPALQPDVIAVKTDLFNGSAGVILFYLRLYEHYGGQHYLEVCITTADTLLYHPEIVQQQYYTFCTGATGLLYLCIKLYEVTGQSRYLDRAVVLTAHFKEGIQQRVVQDDWLSGHAGNLFVLTYLYVHTQEEHLLPLIRSLTDTLIEQARAAPKGLRWGHVKMSYDCLTGFSHGASGMAYAWMQVAACFRDEGLQYLAEQALDYEMQYYDPAARNWLDLRLTNTSIERENFFHWDIRRFREDAAATNTWAHGAAGVGIARLFAYRKEPRAEWLAQLQDAVQRSLDDAQQLKRGDFTLCSGYGGIVFFLLQAAAALRQPALRQKAETLALQAVRYYEEQGTYNSYVPTMMQDAGLFSGLSGVGYMLVSVLMPFREDTVLHPVIRTNSHVSPLYATGEVKHRLFSKYYPHTLRLLIATGWALPDAQDIGMLETVLCKAVTALPEESRPQVADAFAFEQQCTALWKEHRGWLYYTRRKEIAGHLPEMATEVLLQLKWTVTAQVRLCRTHWQWDQQEVDSTAGEYYYLLQNHEYGVAVFPVGKLTAAIFDHLQGGYTLEETLVRCFNAADREQAVTTLVAQTLSLSRQYFIRPA
ncbi:Lanthionine synthetase C-like protein [Chitinophaga eiseniae]|uniref:Lanthionine synthetase C-like protein n=1 Tax=Chitinophaga eiseniae TaxID=634771 RepID=A0A1T4MEM0_9BACT|nr:lanthionine synthetase LanC family protein [Chitinophaga eiseniae]SJZ65479.1 Lanthionine synthetase C-like protein [Chitinophaga eiseniae]